MTGPTICRSTAGNTRRTTKPPKSRSLDSMTVEVAMVSPPSPPTGGQRLEELIIKLNPGVVRIGLEPFVPAVHPDVVPIDRDATDAIARNAGRHGVDAVGGAGLHDG